MTAAPGAPAFRLDGSYRRPGGGDIVLGGSPLRLFRLTAAGRRVADALERGATLPRGHGRLTDRLLDAGAIHPVPGDAGATPGEVTVVIPALDELPETDPQLTTIVVDDASEIPLVAVDRASLRIIRLETNGGPAAARNVGLAEVHTPFVAFVDTDVELPEGWLAPLLAHFADPKVALVAPRVRTSPGGSDVVDSFEALHGSLDLGTVEARIAPGTRVSYVPAAAIVCRTAALRELAGFDEALRFGEDVDLVWRLQHAGWRCRYVPSSVVSHRGRPSLRAWAAQQFQYGTSAAPLATRHPGALAPLRVSGWSAGVWVLIALRRPVAGVCVGVGTVVALQRKLRGVPAEECVRLAGFGHLAAGEQIAGAITRAWFPAALVVALGVRRLRRALAAAVIVPPVLDVVRQRRRSNGERSPRAFAQLVAMHVADDVAYCLGVWFGAVRERDVAALLPDFRNWPPRRSGRRADG